jgi:hypothetical protein
MNAKHTAPAGVVAGGLAIAATALAAPQPTIAVNPQALVYGEGTTVSGTLAGGAANAGNAVTLQQRLPGRKTYADVFTGAADQVGNYAFPVSPGSNVRYRVRAATSPAQRSPSIAVFVRIKVAFRLSDRTPRKNALVRFSGLVTPALDGAPVYLQRKNSAGAYTTVARTRLRDAGDAASQYTRRLRLGRAGTWRVSIPATTTLSTGASVSRVVRVHR